MSRSTPTVLIHGQLGEPVQLTVDQLRGLPARQVQVRFDCRTSGQQLHGFEGPRLWDVLRAAVPRLDAGDRRRRQRYLLAVTGADGHRTALSLAEIDPEFAGQQILLATSIDGSPLDGAGPQLVVPGDACGARYISGITAVWLGEVPEPVDRPEA